MTNGSVLNSYLAKKIFINFAGISLIIFLVIFGNQFYIVARESAKIGLYAHEMSSFIFYKIFRDISLVFILSLSGSLFLTLHKLNKTSEKIILYSSGLGDFNLIGLLKKILIIGLVFTLFLSNFISPWANKSLTIKKQEASNRPAYLFFKENQFQNFNGYTFFSEKIENNKSEQILSDINIFYADNENKKYIYAQKGETSFDENSNVFLLLKSGKIYEYNSTGNSKITDFNNYKFLLHQNKQKRNIDEKNKNLSSLAFLELIGLNSKNSHGEIFYRISQPIFFILICINFILISNKNPRKQNNFSIFLSLILFFLNFNLILISKSLIENGEISIGLGFIISNTVSFMIIAYFVFIKNYSLLRNL